MGIKKSSRHAATCIEEKLKNIQSKYNTDNPIFKPREVQMTNLLINEPPLQVLPSLALEIGLNEAIVLQQVHYWLHISRHKYKGKKWFYKTYDEWLDEFPFWSKNTVVRAINSLEKKIY